MHPPSFLFIITVISPLAQVVRFGLAVEDERYANCGNPAACWNRTVPYPFTVDGQEEYRRHPGYRLKCEKGNLVVTMKSQKYRVLSIDEPNQSMTILRMDLDLLLSSPPQEQGAFVLDESLFNYTLNDLNATLFYNCSQSQRSSCKLHCWPEKSGSHLLVMSDYASEYVESCQYNVSIPILKSSVSDSSASANQVLGNGFEVRWVLDMSECKACNESGVKCRYDKNFIFFCPGGNHGSRCDPKLESSFHESDDAPPDRPPAPIPRPGKSKRKTIVVIGIAAGGTSIMLIALFLCLCYHYRRNLGHSYLVSKCINLSAFSSSIDSEREGQHPGLLIFDYRELQDATNNFDPQSILGDGGFGTVFYGKLRDGRAVAVKRLYDDNYRKVEQFMNEVEILATLRHPNLVKLYGCTSRQSHRLLIVYEYVSNGTVADHLHGKLAKPGSLPWTTRSKIAIETASALMYLHASDVVHRDVKTSNILLDENFSVKVADFGLSRLFPLNVTHITTAPQGTPGYVDPEYHECYQLTEKSDVYSFGVVLMELISSLPAVDITRHRHEINLSTMAINKILSNELQEFVDLNLGFDSNSDTRKMIMDVAELGFRCLQNEKEMRPSMAEVLSTLLEIRKPTRDGDSKEAKESEEAVLLKAGRLMHSPDSVMVRFASTTTASTASS
ncbi:hypothetical protein SAY87_003974 [Trapa incisa]|uniref:non-specific serine/threonine protein kinase n=1 Tax=Trapa incisa TaxID=236973 RepID=A0AAN7JN70_9MYRT|nr:hypothetical protein SAY87_003974 [Trapa incisa]